MMQVGFATRDITPAVGTVIPGNFAPRIATGTFDPLQARTVVIREDDRTAAIVGVDAVSLSNETVRRVRAAIGERCAIAERAIFIAASHTHGGGPANDVLGSDADAAYLDELVTAIADAIAAAHAACQPAEIASGEGCCPGWSFNRRFVMADGSHRSNPPKGDPAIVVAAGPADPVLGIVAFRALDGRPLGAIGNFACHPTTVFCDRFSADWPGCWQAALTKKLHQDFTLVFLNGACGDLSQRDATNVDRQEQGLDWARAMGDALANETIRVIEAASFRTTAGLALAHGEARVTYRRPTPAALADAAERIATATQPWDSKTWQARDLILLAEQLGDDRDTVCPVDVLRLHNAVIAASPWQPFCESGLAIKAGSRFRPTLVATFANGMLGYVPTPAAFAGGGYEPTLCRGSKLTPDSADCIVKETLRTIATVACP